MDARPYTNWSYLHATLHYPHFYFKVFLSCMARKRSTASLCLRSSLVQTAGARTCTKIAEQSEQTALCPKHKPYIIISGRVRVDLIFCLVLIKQLLHYLISPNQVKGWEGDQYISTKSFWTVPGKFSPQMHFMYAGVRSSFRCPCLAWKVRRAALRYFKTHSIQEFPEINLMKNNCSY